ncbi:MAG: undecaprenyl diphosphate synthase family protein, partial [Candidatus Helarchaeota archaeon]
PVFWPDFDENNLVEAIRNFQKRVRKYGGKV